MKNFKTFSSLILLSILFTNCKSDKKSADFKTITENYFNDKNELNPLDATLNGQEKYNDQLQFEMTDSYRKKQNDFFLNYEKQLAEVDKEKLSEEEKNSFDIIIWEIEVGKQLLQQNANLTPIHQFWGTHLTMAQMAGGESAQPFKTEKDYKNFIKRMNLYSVWLDSAMVYMKKGIKEGVVLPTILTEKVIPQFEEMITPKIEDNLFYTTIKTLPKSFSEAQKTEITKQYTSVINEKLMPKYKLMAEFLKSEYLPASRSTSGIGTIPGGKELYKTYVKQWTTTNMTPEEIHTLGLSEVKRLNSEMEKVKTQVGFKGTLKEFFNYVRSKPELKPFKKPEEVIANFERIHQIEIPL